MSDLTSKRKLKSLGNFNLFESYKLNNTYFKIWFHKKLN